MVNKVIYQVYVNNQKKHQKSEFLNLMLAKNICYFPIKTKHNEVMKSNKLRIHNLMKYSNEGPRQNTLTSQINVVVVFDSPVKLDKETPME